MDFNEHKIKITTPINRKPGVKDYTVFISSSDSYSDLWPVFFELFRKQWPEYEGKIYLNTEESSFSFPGLNIECTMTGRQGKFGRTFRAGLEKVESDSLMLIMIDYLFTGRVDNKKVESFFSYFKKNNLDSLCLAFLDFPNTTSSEIRELYHVHPPAPHKMFSYQIAFWKKSVLYQMAMEHENPWTSEWYGSKRAEKMGIRLAAVSEKKYSPVLYDLAGCLHKGKWISDSVSFLRSNGYNADYDRRGFYTERPLSIKDRLRTKWMIIKDGIKGSYLDLLTRNSIH